MGSCRGNSRIHLKLLAIWDRYVWWGFFVFFFKVFRSPYPLPYHFPTSAYVSVLYLSAWSLDFKRLSWPDSHAIRCWAALWAHAAGAEDRLGLASCRSLPLVVGEIVPDSGHASPSGVVLQPSLEPLLCGREEAAHVHGPSHLWDCWRCSLAPSSSSHSFPAFPPPLCSPVSQFPPSLPQQQEAAFLLLSNTTQCSLSHEDLVPGSSYVARVRARPGQASSFSGPYSKWSMEVSWKTPEGSMGWSEAVQGWKPGLSCH